MTATGIDIGPFDPTRAPDGDLVDYHRLVLASGRIDRPDEEPPSCYRLARWTGAAPAALVESYAEARAAIHDAPAADSTFRHPSWTVGRVRAHERDLCDRGVEQRVVVAVHEATRAVVGLTELELHPNPPDLGFQSDTAVSAAHRGHGLGRFMKAAMVRWLVEERPAVRRIGTSTAADNTSMIAVNHQTGYRTVRFLTILTTCGCCGSGNKSRSSEWTPQIGQCGRASGDQHRRWPI
jgi:mycothiol synthase